MDYREYKRRKTNKIAVLILIIFLLLCLIGAVGYLGFNMYSEYAAEQSYESILDFAQGTIDDEEEQLPEEEELVDNPIDFASLKAKNEDVYAWINIPNTNINYPVVQSNVDDNYYLNRSIDKKYLFVTILTFLIL